MKFCGIDFGTSNSAVCLAANGKHEMVRLDGDSTNIPSAIFFDTEENKVTFGQAGIDAFTSGQDGRLMRSLKSILGTDLIHDKTQIGMRHISFEDILTTFISHLKDKAESQQRGELSSVVMGRPVHFVDGNPEADKRAQDKLEEVARKSGFKEIEFQFEPIAAALSYESSLEKDELALIADIGGGTSDFSIIRVGPNHRRKTDRSEDILANTGVRVGGTNLDARLSLTGVMPHLGMDSESIDRLSGGRRSKLPAYLFYDLATWYKIHMLYNLKFERFIDQLAREVDDNGEFERYVEIIHAQKGHLLAAMVEQAKIELSSNPSSHLGLGKVINSSKLDIPLERPTFEAAINEERAKISAAIDLCLKEAGVTPANITAIFLTGGSTAVPAIKQTICEKLPGGNIVSGDLFNSVGKGLGIEADRVFA